VRRAEPHSAIFGGAIAPLAPLFRRPWLATHFMRSKMLTNKKQKNFSPKNKKALGMACHIPPLKKAKKQGEMPLPSLGPIPSLNSTFF